MEVPPVLFLHAFPLGPRMWDRQVNALAEAGLTSMAPALPGFGGRTAGEPDLGAFARAILCDMDEAGIDRVILAGLSMGGYVAFRIFDEAPERVAGLVLADTRAGPDADEAKAARKAQADRALAEGVGWLADEMTPKLLCAGTLAGRPAVERSVHEMIGQADPAGVAGALLAMRDRPDSTCLLPTVRVPALLLVGEYDSLTPPSETKRMAESLPDPIVKVIPDAGHLSNMENPRAFNAALLEFVR